MARYLPSPGKLPLVLALLLTAICLSNIMWIHGPAASPPASAFPAPLHPDTDSNGYAGSVSCRSCHADICDSHIRTAHYQDSRPAAKPFIKGNFDPPNNHFVYNNKMEVILEDKAGQLSQTAYLNGTLFQSETFDLVIGSGRKGQTYLYWDDNKLFQLPVSYYTPLDRWCNSPGYPSNFIYFNKLVTPNCMECHSTYAKAEQTTADAATFDRNSIVYGIDCERCHGPAARHTRFHTAHPGEKPGRFILNAGKMNRQQRLDACALCHSGSRTPLRPAFTFMTGDTLDRFSIPRYDTSNASGLDVHGNQYGLLTASKCFKFSQMDCSSCHNTHVNEINNTALFSARCMSCHSEASHHTCTLLAVKELKQVDNCIDCHMPALPSQKIFLQVDDPGKSTADLVRTHRIAIYEERTKAFLEKWKRK